MVGKQNVKDFQALTKSQADAFEYMGKPLSKTKMLTDDKNLYTVANSAKALLSFGQTVGHKQIQIAQELHKKMYTEVTDLRKQLSKAIKNAIKEEKRLKSDLANARSAVASAKKKDLEEAKNYEALKTKLSESDDLTAKKQQSLQAQLQKAEKSTQNANKAYAAAYENLKKVDEAYYSKLADLMESLEVLDRKRLESMKSLLMRYHNLQLELAQLIMNECDNMRQSFDQINPDLEIQTFVRETKSGESPPPIEPFEPYDLNGSGAPRRLSSVNNSVSSKSNSTSLSSGSPATPSSPVTVPAAPSSIKKNASQSTEKVRALYDYDAQGEGELSFKENDVIEVLDKQPDCWWMGKLGNMQGLFPSNFVELLTDGAGPDPATTNTAPSQVLVTTALYDYDAEEQEELSFKEGDVIEVIQRSDDGWWYGKLSNGKTGLFPSNFTSIGAQQ